MRLVVPLIYAICSVCESREIDPLVHQYERACSEQPSDINEHLPLLRQLALECSSVVEIGLRNMVSSWGLLQGLSENPTHVRSYIGIDINIPPSHILNLAKQLAEHNGISFRFWQANDLDIDIEPTELLFIDSLHLYCHLTYELETFSPMVSKYIAIHDTSEPWGYYDECYVYNGDRSEYPAHYSRTKRGCWPAVEDFLKSHSEWILYDRRFNQCGFTILKRVSK